MGSATTLAQFKRKIEEVKRFMALLKQKDELISEYDRGILNGAEYVLAIFEWREPRYLRDTHATEAAEILSKGEGE